MALNQVRLHGNRFIDRTGKRYGNLTAIKYIKTICVNGKSRKIWLCQCDCGNFVEIRGENLGIKKGKTKSCGCSFKKINITHGDSIKGSKYYKLYKIWCAIKSRCDNKKIKEFKFYGKKGIIYDPRWGNYENFKKDMLFKWISSKKKFSEKCLSIERLIVTENYCFDNCVFIPRNKQFENQRKNKWFKAISSDGKEYIDNNQTEFAKRHKLVQSSISLFLNGKINYYNGWSFNFVRISNYKIKTLILNKIQNF